MGMYLSDRPEEDEWAAGSTGETTIEEEMGTDQLSHASKKAATM